MLTQAFLFSACNLEESTVPEKAAWYSDVEVSSVASPSPFSISDSVLSVHSL